METGSAQLIRNVSHVRFSPEVFSGKNALMLSGSRTGAGD
jgi:hypothetical protein